MGFLANIVAAASVVLLIASYPPGVRADSCTITSYDQISSVVSSCSTVTFGSFTVPSGNKLDIKFLDGAYVTFTGQIKFEHYNGDGPLIKLTISNGVVKGDDNHLFNGLGETYWGLSDTKPLLMRLVGQHTGFYGFKIKNCPQRCVSINSSKNSVIGSFIIDNTDGIGKAKNTDGFDVSSSSNIVIKDTTVTNQDDCVAINSGSDILVDNLHCIGSHGFDISVGQGSGNTNFVTNVTFQNSILTEGMVGLSMLSHVEGGTGEVNTVNYNNIKIEGATDYAVFFHQDFSSASQGNTGVPVGTVVFSDITLNNVSGYVDSNKAAAVCLRCASGYCKNFNFNGLQISGAKKKDECSIQPNGYKCNT
ncbi:polygalacturonase-like [Cylas formicarius]|uniref:polygalacturonase-like n=1 Tax=Cylas formicarius TaxID=197179 RepID=UPI00295845D2|nr:polygalacturonase-like [Cylas formicarius]